MKKQIQPTASAAQKTISLALTFSMLANLALPAAAQTTPRRIGTTLPRLEARQDNTRLSNQVEMRVRVAQENQRLAQGSLSEDQVSRLWEIHSILRPADTAAKNTSKSDLDLFTEIYRQHVQNEVTSQKESIRQEKRNLLKQLNEQEAALPQDAQAAEVEAWKAQTLEQINKWESDALAELTKWEKAQLAATKKNYEKYGKNEFLKQREKVVRDIVKELWDFQKYHSSLAHDIFLEVAPTLAVLKTMDNKSFFSAEQQQWLEKEYVRTITNFKKTDKCNSQPAGCAHVSKALVGLSMLAKNTTSANAISNLIHDNLQGEMATPILLNGIVALLAMKEYSKIRGIIHQATLKETDISNFDMLSFSTWVNAAANINGQYLGEVSKYMQYPLTEKANENSAMGNAWEDVAMLLANDGSAEALNILRQYGVEKCVAQTDTNLHFKTEIKGIRCGGIIPFLVGALASGKSGADKYAPKFLSEEEGWYTGSAGSQKVTAQQAANNRRHNQNKINEFRQYVAKTGLTAEAAVARHLFVQSMGDLNAESELAIDTKLYKVYAKSASKQRPNAGYAIQSYTRGSAAYNAKAVRQDRTRWFRKAAVWADIAVLLWCAYDITKWGRTAYKVSKGIYTASKMARGGATVAQRATMLRNLNIAPKLRSFVNIPSKIKGGMEPVVLAQMPLFTTPVKMPEIAGFIPSAGTAVLESARFSAETGVLGVNAGEVATVSGGQFNLQTGLQLNNAMNDASVAANTAFANRSWFQRTFTFNKNASYRRTLASALQQQGRLPGLSLQESSQLAFELSSMPSITVPSNIQTFKAPELFKGGTLQYPALARVMKNALGVEPAADLTAHTASLLNKALYDTNVQFANRGWFARSWSSVRGNANAQYKNMLLSNLAAAFDADGLLFTNPSQYKVYQSLVSAISNDLTLHAPNTGVLASLRGVSADPAKVTYREMGSAILQSNDPAVLPQELPLNISIDRGIRGVNRSGYQRVLFTDKDNTFLFGVGNNLGKPIQLQNFKITLDSGSLPELIRAAGQTVLEKPLELKLTPQSTASWFGRQKEAFSWRTNAFKAARAEGQKFPIGTLLRDKANIYIHEIPVFIAKADGTTSAVPMVFKADSYLGLKNVRAVLGTDGKLSWLRGNQALEAVPNFSIGLPKNQLRPFLSATQNAASPLNMTVISGRNKVKPLMWATGLSLSSASSSLIPSLETNYGDRITETDKTMISLALPYIPSFAAPALTPFVMKFGALRTLQFALGISTAGLAFTAANGFKGSIDHENLPPIWPLYVSGTAIGISSALSRASLNLLIDRMGGGGSLLKSMAFKNIGSFSLLVPQIAFSSMGFKTDFSLAFPVTGALSAGALMWVSSSRIDTGIGRVADFMKTAKLDWKNPVTLPKTLFSNSKLMLKEGWKETWNSIRLLGTKELLLPTLAATAFTGFEASSFNKATNQLIRPKVEDTSFVQGFGDATDRKNWTSLLTSGTVVMFPLLTRFGAKPLLNKMANPAVAGLEYQRMLKLSYGLNIGGTALLMANGFDGFDSTGFLGMAMIGVGTANMTQSLQKLSNISIARSGFVLKRTAGMSVADAAAFKSNTVTKAMTTFPVSQLGLALLPLYVSRYTDDQIERGVETKANAPYSSLWIPMTSIGASLMLSSPMIWKGLRIPTGLTGLGIGLDKGLHYQNTLNTLGYPATQSYMTQPENAPAFPTPSQAQPEEVPADAK